MKIEESVTSKSLSSYEDENDSVFMQCEMIFDNRFEDPYINKIREKRTVNKSDDKFYNDYERACQVLEKGIPAVKYNFSNE